MAGLFGRFQRKPVQPEVAMGHPGKMIVGGFVSQDETNPALVGTARYDTFSGMLANVSIVAAGTRYFLNFIGKANWKPIPPNDSPEAQFEAEWTESVIDKMDTPWHRVIRRSAMFRFYGFSVQEWTARRLDDGTIGYKNISTRPQRTIERWDVDIDGTILGMIQRSPQTGEELYLPRVKTLYMVDDSIDDGPEGLGLYRHLATPAAHLQRLETLEGYNFEMDLRGVPIGRAPFAALRAAVKAGKMSEAQFNSAIGVLNTFIDKHIKSPQLGLVLDSATYTTTDEKGAPSPQKQWDVEVMQSDSAHSAVAAAATIERKNREMARILGVEHLMLGGDGQGSLALSQDKNDSFALIIDSTLQELVATMNKDFLEPLWIMNGKDPELMPRFKTDAIQHRSVESITQALKDMAAAGAIMAPDDPAIDEVRDILGLSDHTEADLDALGLLNPNDPAIEPNDTGNGTGDGDDDNVDD